MNRPFDSQTERATQAGQAAAQPLRVLLISPLPGLDPPSGDVTYTRQLLSCPPPGVTYTTYDEALADGSLSELGTRGAVRDTTGCQRLWQVAIAGGRKAEGLLRRSGIAYRERIRVFKIRENAFDLIHVHVFHHRFVGQHPPVVVSAGGPLRWVYGDAWHWSRYRIAVADAIDRGLGWLWDATMCASRLGRADLFISPSEYLRATLLSSGWPNGQLAVQPNYLSAPVRPPDRTAEEPKILGFVARDFYAKGGTEVLGAFGELRRRHPDLRLWIVGSPPQLSPAEQRLQRIVWTPEVDRGHLLRDILPSIDILIYPSHFDTGVPYVTMEALASGVPAVVSDYRSLPDLVGSEAGLVCRVHDAHSVAEATEALLDPSAWAAASEGATRRFSSRFSAATQAPRLRQIYDRVLRMGWPPSQ